MVLLPPIVVEIRDTQELLQYVLEHHAEPSTLIICSSKADFLESLQPADTISEGASQPVAESEQHSEFDSVAAQVRPFAPTLRLLSRSRTVKLAFCPDITHLRAYLACLHTDNTPEPANQDASNRALRIYGAVPILAILNPIELHRPTSAFSAQGLNRTFSVAVEAAHRCQRKLVLAEAAFEAWSEELSILNVTNRRLGELAVGRTVKAKAVAERWCLFEKHVSSEL